MKCRLILALVTFTLLSANSGIGQETSIEALITQVGQDESVRKVAGQLGQEVSGEQYRRVHVRAAVQLDPRQAQHPALLPILYEAGKWVAENHEKIRNSIGNVGGEVTSIEEFVNETPYAVQIVTLDGGNPIVVDLKANETKLKEVWIPWADDQQQFVKKQMAINIQGHRLGTIWQSGPFIRFAPGNRFVQNSHKVPGVSEKGGDRRLVIKVSTNGCIGFAIGYFQQ